MIKDEKPEFMTVSDVLKDVCHRTEREYLHQELEIELDELKERHLVSSLEELFHHRRIYKEERFEQGKKYGGSGQIHPKN